MEDRFKISRWLQEVATALHDHPLVESPIAKRKEYANEGDEFLDDAIRTMDQAFVVRINSLPGREDAFEIHTDL